MSGKSLQYTAPETPAFLKALKAQVSGNERAKRGGRDQLDSLLSASASHAEGSDDDDDDGAQVVVLSDKHLTAEQAHEAKAEARAPPQPAPPTGKQPHAGKRRRDTIITDDDPLSKPRDAKGAKKAKPTSDGGTLADVKQLLRTEKQAHTKKQARTATRTKHKAGKGLSFSLDD